jgi:hypothetical protein
VSESNARDERDEGGARWHSARRAGGGSFVGGMLIEKQCEYEAICYLAFLLDGGIILPVFSTATERAKKGPVGAQLQIGRSYRLLLLVRPRQLRYPLETAGVRGMRDLVAVARREIARDARGVSGERVRLEHQLLRGQVVEADWWNGERRYVLLETAIGRVVLSRRTLETDLKERADELVAGSWLAWEPWRLELLEVLGEDRSSSRG